MPRPSAFHTGRADLHLVVSNQPTPTFRLDAGWIGEPYTITGATPSHTAQSYFNLSFQYVVTDVRYLVVVDTLP